MTPMATTSATTTVGGRAWIESDKSGRQVVHVEVGGRQVERKRKDVIIDDVDLANELASTLKTAPVRVFVELKGDKLMRVRRA